MNYLYSLAKEPVFYGVMMVANNPYSPLPIAKKADQ